MRRVTTRQDNGSETQAFADRGERLVAVGGEAEVMHLGGNRMRLIEAGGRRVIPGMLRTYTRSTAACSPTSGLAGIGWQRFGALEMIRHQAKRPPIDPVDACHRWLVSAPVQAEDADRRAVKTESSTRGRVTELAAQHRGAPAQATLDRTTRAGTARS
jgi:hypothetical protein